MNIEVKTIASGQEQELRKQFMKLYQASPIPEQEQLANLGLYVKRQELSKSLFLYELYKQFVNVQGVIMEFGVRWGQNLTTLNNLRGMLEPYNYGRKIIGFDTFEGFPQVHEQDGKHEIIKKGAFAVTKDYELYLEQILNYHEKECPLNHISKNTLVKGDAVQQLESYLKQHPETIVAFAYFDFDIYEPTRRCLELLVPHLTKGAIIGFDELCDPHFPGETQALKDVLGTNNIRLKRFNFTGLQSYCIVE